MGIARRDLGPRGRILPRRLFEAAPSGLLTHTSARQFTLLLVLAAALAGLFLLLGFVVSLTSSAPQDLLAGTPLQEGMLTVPNGVQLIEALVLAVSVVLAVSALVLSAGWPIRRAVERRPLRLALGVLIAAALVATGAILAFSGVLGGSISYDEHLVRRVDLETGSLVTLAALFLTVTIAGLLHWRLFAGTLLAWLIALGAFGLIDSKSIDGLLLFPRTNLQEVPGEFASAVSGIQGEQSGTLAAPESGDPLLSAVTARRNDPPSDAPVFEVTGAAHTRYLRTSTGDRYQDGAWSQLDRTSVRLDSNAPVLEALESLASQPHLPIAEPLHEFNDRIAVTPVPGADALPPGSLPVAKNLRSIDTPVVYFPFNETMASDRSISLYEMETSLPLFSLSQRVNAPVMKMPSYLELPETLPARVIDLADEFRGEVSPYLKARVLQVYLQEEYAYGLPGQGGEAQPTNGQDPVDWFLFEHGIGTSSNFSSAFVVLARALEIPARVVSGWVIATQEQPQTVFRSQAHQWAEIALSGLGWVTVDPFPRDALSGSDVDHAWLAALDGLAASSRPDIREAASALRGDSEDADSLRQLFEAIDGTPDAVARHAAQVSVGSLAFDRFTEMLLEHDDAKLRTTAAYGLGVLADRASQSALIASLSADSDAGVRAAAAGALAVVGKNGAEQSLLQALEGDEDASVRAASASALGALKTFWTAAQMLPALESDSSSAVRGAVAQALGEIGDNDSLLPLLDVRENDTSAGVRDVAADALGKWEFGALIEILDSDVEAELRAAAVQLMGEGRLVEAIVPLGTALSDETELVRRAAREALGVIGEVNWLESGGGVLMFQGDFAFLPYVTAESHEIADPTPLFRVRGSANTSLLRVAVGDVYEDGEWYAAEQDVLTAGVAGIEFRDDDIRPRQPEDAGALDSIYLSGIGFAQSILDGPVPTSLHAEAFSIPVGYRVPSHTVTARGTALYGWDAKVYHHTEEQLISAQLWDDATGSNFTQLPEADWVGRARSLARSITAGHATPYAKAKAIERHLIDEYTYQPSAALFEASADFDPVEAFLFDVREGTSGALSSAFVILARSVGIPARVVSGWAVADRAASQIVFGDQSHQWVEVPFEDLGWVTFDPAPDGAPSRVPEDPREVHERLGAVVTVLETGGTLVQLDGETFFTGGTTAHQAEATPPVPLLEVAGAANTGYLRMSVGEVYEGGQWSQLDPAAIPYSAGNHVPTETREFYDELIERGDTEFADRLNSVALPSQGPSPLRSEEDRIQIRRAGELDELPHGVMPTSRGLQRKDIDGVYHPFGTTFSAGSAPNEYSWTTSIDFFSRDQYEAATAADASTYEQLPADLSGHVRDLAEQIASGSESDYERAEAIERYLRSNYTYVAAGSAADAPPPGRDPVEWFLFNTREGTSGQFSSAFVILARAVDIPSRVVGGFVISPGDAPQELRSDQAHQWAEAAFEGVGWVRFDPTAAGGAPSRVPGSPPVARELARADAEEDARDTARDAVDTITEIAESPESIRRRAPFAVDGTVRAANGQPVSGMIVEIYINETKEHGGTKIGETTSRSGRFAAEAQLPPTMELGDYQLLARAVGNSLFNESWSDPDVQVVSGNKIELSGPTEVEPGAVAEFSGRVTDDSELGISQRVIKVTSNGATTPSTMTDDEGRFNFTATFSQLGEHWVEVKLDGEELLLDNTARLSLDVVLPTQLALYAAHSVALGEALLVTGELREAGGPPLKEGEVELAIEGPGGAVDTVTVDVAEDGSFEHTIPSFERTGQHTLTGRFAAGGFVRPAAAEIAVQVLRPTLLTLDGPAAVQEGERFAISGTLLERDGRPVANAVVQVPGAEPLTLATDAEGRFAGELRATFDESAAHDPHESSLRVRAVFDDTAELASSDAALTVAVGVPWILVEALEPVTRGGEAILRGAVLVGATVPLPGVELTAGPDLAFQSSDAGSFVQAYRVPAGEPLGATDLVINAPNLGVEATVRLVVRSATTLIVTPVGEVNPGGTTTLQVALLDDTGAGIAGAALRSSQGVDATTDASGIATLELAVPETEDLPGGHVDITYAGDDRHAPLDMPYYWEAAITPGGVNWLLWAGVPALIALLVAAAYAGRRFVVMPLLRRRRRRRAPAEPVPPTADAAESAAEPEDTADANEDEAAEGESEDADAGDDAGAERHSIRLRIAFLTEADDLPDDVWGPGEEIPISVSATDGARPLAGAAVDVSVGDGAPSRLTLDEDGAGALSWSGTEPGEHPVGVELTTDDGLVVSESRSLRIVDFREEIVRLYGVFLEWAKAQGAGVTDPSTPREAEALLVASGLPLPRRDLAEIVARFEEADYSEHEIARWHYEAMYRAQDTVPGAER